MAVRYPSELKQTKHYEARYPNGTKKNLGKFVKIENHRESSWLSYGSSTVLPKDVVFENKTFKDTELFPTNDWDRITAPEIHEVSVSRGGKQKTTRRKTSKRKSSKRKSKSKSKKNRSHRR